MIMDLLYLLSMVKSKPFKQYLCACLTLILIFNDSATDEGMETVLLKALHIDAKLLVFAKALFLFQ